MRKYDCLTKHSLREAGWMQAAAAHEMEISHPLAVMERTHEKQQNFMNF